jgi:hypothetical protein
MFRTIFSAKQVRMGKNTKANKQSLVVFGLIIEENMELFHINFKSFICNQKEQLILN